MTKVLAGLFLVGGLWTACTDYQDEVDALDHRITTLEDLVDRVNDDIDAMEVIAKALEDADYITGVKEQDGGYAINFAKAGPVFIKDGTDGLDGKDGKDAAAPELGMAQGPDGNYYWTLDGVFLMADDGDPTTPAERVRVNGKDGADGKDGKDAVSPEVRINPNTGEWEVSTDGGQNWTPTGTQATGKDGQNGKDGENGKDANPFFLSVKYEVYEGMEFMTVTTKSGQVFRIPIVKG